MREGEALPLSFFGGIMTAANLFRCLCCGLLVAGAVTAWAAEESGPPIPGPLRFDLLLDDALARGLIAGAVVQVGNRDGVLLERAYGRVGREPEASPMTAGAIFDVASLTKVVATAPAVLKLAEEGKVSLVDPVVRWFPEFGGKGRDDLRVVHLLTHTSGLDDLVLEGDDPLRSAVEGAAAQRQKGETGSRFRYADINFILLGELVRRVSGTGLDRYSEAAFYGPLGMRDTGFLPNEAKRPLIVPTLTGERELLQGQPQDLPARQLGGVAGHAGLFSTVHDLGTYCRMLLRGGEANGTRVLAVRTVEQMTVPYFSRGGSVMRGLGWDMASPFSSPKGNGFSETSFGHTGYSGSSLWIDPELNLYVVLLTFRLEYRKLREFSQLRSDLSTLAVDLFHPGGPVPELAARGLSD